MSIDGQLTAIGRYQLVRLLGRGGMGEVYLARDPVLDRDVAVKLIGGGIDDGPARERLIREARAAGRLQHANIVTVFDAGEHEGRPFIAMEFVPGETMGSLVRRRASLPLPRRLELIEGACAGLAHAHRAGIIHLDVKPDNLMLDEAGVVKVVDFGIARVLQNEAQHTRHLAGTLRYMSPEQVEGRPIDRRSDIFSLGCALYEIVAYTPAFTGSVTEIISRIANGPIPNLRDAMPGIHPGLAAIVSRAMARDPSERYGDLEMLRAEIGRLRRDINPGDESRVSAPIPSVSDAVPTTAITIAEAAASLPEKSALEEAETIWQPASSDLSNRTDQGAGPSRSGLITLLGMASVLGVAVAAALWVYSPSPLRDNASAVPTRPAITPPQPQLPQDPAPSRPAETSANEEVWRRLALGDRDGVLRVLRSAGGATQDSQLASDVIDAVRATIPRARRAAGGPESTPGSSKAYNAGEERLARANQLRASDRPLEALAALWEAVDLYSQAAAAAGRPAPSTQPVERQAQTPMEPAVTPERAVQPSAPEVDTERVEGAAPVADTTSPAEPPDAPPEPPRARPDEDAIRETLRRYQAAYQALDPAAVQRVFPSLGADQLQQLRRGFGEVTAYEMELQNQRVSVQGDVGTVHALVVRRQVPRVGRPLTNSVETEFMLLRRGAEWVIVRVEAR
jgi:eukaryotic-like serine/threonine-protein kinase